MKKIVILLIAVFTLSIGLNAQYDEEKYSIPKSKLTAEQLAEIEQAELEKKLERYGNWVGVGGEVGNAMREGLEALGDFSDTELGKYTMILIAWKVVGKDVVRIILGLLFIFLITVLFNKVYRNTFQVKKVAKVKHPFWQRLRKSTEYEIVKPDLAWDGVVATKILILFLYAGAFGITYAIMFG